jgi:hypothetical protein
MAAKREKASEIEKDLVDVCTDIINQRKESSCHQWQQYNNKYSWHFVTSLVFKRKSKN